MNFLDALRTGKKIAYPKPLLGVRGVDYGFPGQTTYAADTFMEPTWLLETIELTPELLLSDKWYVLEPSVRITRSQFWDAYREAKTERNMPAYAVVQRMATMFGLEEAE